MELLYFCVLLIFVGGQVYSVDVKCSFERTGSTRTCHLDNVRIFDENTILNVQGDGKEEDVTEVQLRGQINQISNQLFSKFPNLTVLEVWTANLKSIKRSHLKGANNLETINLGGNDLTELGPYAFQNAPKLKRISLHDNKIRYIDEDAFKGLRNLAYLTLHSNKLKMTKFNTFSDLKNLRTLDLNWNICVDKYFSSTEGIDFNQVEESLDACDESYKRELKNSRRISWRNEELKD